MIEGASPSRRQLRVGMVLYSGLANDSRVRREATTLARAGYQIALTCLEGTEGTPDLPGNVEVLVRTPTTTSTLPGTPSTIASNSGGSLRRLFIRIKWFGDYARNLRSWGRMAIAACGPVDIWHAHDLPGLVAISSVLSTGVPVIYDSHEIFLDAGTASLLPGVGRALLRKYERRLLRNISAVVTVNKPLAQVLQSRYGLRRVVVVYNAPARWDPPAEPPNRIRQALGLGPGVPVVLYHGVFSADRGLIPLALSMLAPGLEGAHLAYLGLGVMARELVDLSRDPRFGGRIHVLPAVSPTELLPWVASADVVAMPIEPTTLSHRLATPNKLFEALAAGVPVVASDSPGMAPIVLNAPNGPLGETCNPTDPLSIGAAIRRILDLDSTAYADLRSRCLRAGHDRWNWETEGQKLVELYEDLCGPISHEAELVGRQSPIMSGPSTRLGGAAPVSTRGDDDRSPM